MHDFTGLMTEPVMKEIADIVKKKKVSRVKDFQDVDLGKFRS